jgi:hypothetical protein
LNGKIEMKLKLGTALAFALLITTALGGGPEVKLLRVPDGGVQPQALVDATGTLHMVYLKGDSKACDVFYCSRLVGTADFTSPLRVNSVPGSAIAIGTVRGAQLALGRNGRIHVAWNGSGKGEADPGSGEPMLYTRMNDNRTGFEPQRNLMTSTIHLDGGGSVAADPDGTVYVVWHGHRKTGPQEEIDRAVFLARSMDDGKTFTPERAANPPETGVCACCGLKAYAGVKGSLAILYRSAGATGNRDSELLLSSNHGQTFSAQVLGRWHVSTCPMSTHALGLSATGFRAAWEREGQIYTALIPAIAAIEPVRQIEAGGNAGKRKHPAIAALEPANSPVLLAWTEGTGWEQGGALAWECLDADSHQTASGRVEGIPVWSYAAAVAERSGAFTLIY